MLIDARKEKYDLVELDDITCLFTNLRIQRDTVPAGLFCYDVRDSDDLDGSFAEVAPFILVNHWGTIISKEPFPMNEFSCYYPKDTEPAFLDHCMTLEEFLVSRVGEKASDAFYIGKIKVYTVGGQQYCQFPDEESPRRYRENIRDIETGDAFLVAGSIRTAESASHQNFDEPDDPWIVYDEGGDCWFEEDFGSDPRSSSFYHTVEEVETASEKVPLNEQLQQAEDRSLNTAADHQSPKRDDPEHEY